MLLEFIGTDLGGNCDLREVSRPRFAEGPRFVGVCSHVSPLFAAYTNSHRCVHMAHMITRELGIIEHRDLRILTVRTGVHGRFSGGVAKMLSQKWPHF